MIDLFKFQAEDVEKLHTMRSRLIGNEPGTGKTYEGIALDQLNRSGQGNAKVNLQEIFPTGKLKTLVIAPKSVLDVWDQHCMELTDEDVYVIDSKNRDVFVRDALHPQKDGYFICHWESLRLMPELQKVHWFHIIGDEIHRAKNRKSQQTLALKKLTAVYKTGASGTPADNKPQDLWSILNWLWPNYYTSYWAFTKAYLEHEMARDPKTGEALGYYKFSDVKDLPVLHEQMRPWFVRRLKTDVLPDLPDKYYTRMWVDLSPKQRRSYDQMRKTMVAWAEQYKDEIERQDPIIANAVVAQLVRLQQYADGYLVPRLDADGEHMFKTKMKYNKSIEDYEEVKTFLFDMTDPSSKLDALMELLEDRGEEQIVVFSQFKTVISLLEERLRKESISYGLLTGDVSQEDRATNVADFQAGKLRVFAGTIAAGGVGITLTAASTIVFIDRSWSPAINLQAEDRCHRIGQAEAVEVIDIMARNTVDLGKAQKLAHKWAMLQKLLGDEVDQMTLAREMEDEE